MSFICLCAANPHIHQHQRNKEKVEDAWNSVHYKDGEHHSEFDHEAILGSKKDAQEFDQLPPDVAKVRLKHLILKGGMDANKDGHVDKNELISWVETAFKKLAEEEGVERLEEEDFDEDGYVSWDEHLKDSFDIEGDGDEAENKLRDELMVEDKALWKTADLNGDGRLDRKEFPAFNSPEEYEYMHNTLYEQTMLKRDKDRDGYLSLNEFMSDIHGNPMSPKSENYLTEKDRFENDYDQDKDGKLNKQEVLLWIIPDNR